MSYKISRKTTELGVSSVEYALVLALLVILVIVNRDSWLYASQEAIQSRELSLNFQNYGPLIP